MHINNEVGTILDIERVGSLCQSKGAIFHSDMVQSIGHYEIDLSELHIDFIAVSAHKFHGPKGVGFIYINGDNMIQPFIDGGAQERNMRGGTENVYGIVGLAKALEMATEEMAERVVLISAIRNYLAEQLKANFED